MGGAQVTETIFEVFGQADRGEPYTHMGSLIAPDPEMALVLSKEVFCRRGEAVSLWVAPREAFTATPRTDSGLLRATDRSYRLGEGYRITVEKRSRLKRTGA